MTTPKLVFPVLVEGATNSESTVNDTFKQIDALLPGQVEDRDLTAPPGSPSDGALYIVAASATGDWAGQDGNLALWNTGLGWRFFSPVGGMTIYIHDEDVFKYYNSTSGTWDDAGGGAADHGALTGLADDDHTQYLLVAGTRAMTGDLDMGTNAITNVGNVDGVDISSLVSLTVANLRSVIGGLTDTQGATADRFVYWDADGTLQQCSHEDIVTQAHSDLGIVPQNRISTSTDPGVNDDGAGTNGINHLVNDLWTNTTTDTSWICQDITTGAAVWKPIALTKTGTTAPAVAPDFVGQVFLDTTNENIYIGIDTVNAADFLQVDGGSVTEKDIEDIIEGLTPAAPATADEFVFRDVSGTDALGCATAQQIVAQGNSDLGIVPQNRISTTTDPGANDDGAGTNGINHLVNDLWTNTTTDTSWICQDITTGAAVWKPIALTKTGTTAPAVAPDFVGQVFLDTTNENIYIGIDTVNAADFVQVNGGGGDLWSDVVDADIVPDADGTRDLGADATRFAQAYIDELHSTGGLLVTESADHTNTPAAGKGEFWVRNDTPCTPVFTDDAGVDHDLYAGEWFMVTGDGPTTSTADEQLWMVVPYDCTLKEIRWSSQRSMGSSGTNYWTLMPKRRDGGGDVDLLDAVFSTSGGINEDTSYDLGTITTNGTDDQLSKGDVLMVTFTAVGTPQSFFGGRQGYAIHLEPR